MSDDRLFATWKISLVFAINVLPLVLVLTGSMQTADLLLAYVIETGIGLVPVIAAIRRSRATFFVDKLPVGILNIKVSTKAVVIIALCWAWLQTTQRVVTSVDWTLTRGLVSLLTAVALSGSAWYALHRGTTPGVGGLLGRQIWQLFVIVIGAFAGLGAAESYVVLVDHGWTPSQVGGAWAYPFGTLFGTLAQRFDVAPEVFPAIMIVGLMTVNETLAAVRRALKPAPAGEGGLAVEPR